MILFPFCQLCNRVFANAEEEQSFLQSNNAKMEKIVPADKAERTKAAVKAAKARLEQLQALQSVYDSAHALRSKEIPALEAQLAQLAGEIATATARKSELELEQKKQREAEDAVLEHVKITAAASRVFADVCALYDALRRSEVKLAAEAEAAGSAGGAGGPRSLEAVSSEFESLERLNVSLQKECSGIQDQLEAARTRKQALVEKVTRLKEQRMDMNRIEIEQQKLKKDEQETNALYAQLKADVNAMVRWR